MEVQSSQLPVCGCPLKNCPTQTLHSVTTSIARLTWVNRSSLLKGSLGGTGALQLPSKSLPCSVLSFSWLSWSINSAQSQAHDDMGCNLWDTGFLPCTCVEGVSYPALVLQSIGKPYYLLPSQKGASVFPGGASLCSSSHILVPLSSLALKATNGTWAWGV